LTASSTSTTITEPTPPSAANHPSAESTTLLGSTSSEHQTLASARSLVCDTRSWQDVSRSRPPPRPAQL
jgi:hypothetical protein